MKALGIRWMRGPVFAAAMAVMAACGGGGDSTPAAPGSISLLAGSLQRAGSQDGIGTQAQFNGLRGVAQDGAGIIYVADTDNHTIRRIDPSGAVSTLAGAAGQPGSADGTGAAARFAQPRAVAVGASGDVYVADTGNHVIRKISSAGVVTTVAGSAGQPGAIDGPGSAARFTSPRGLALDAAGSLFVADASGAVRKVAADGTVTSFAGKLGEQGFVVGDGVQARFTNVLGVAVGADGTVFVSELSNPNASGQIRRFDSQGRALPWGDAPQGVLGMPYPVGIAASAGGDLLVASSGTFAPVPGHGQRYNTIWRITPEGTPVLVAGQDGPLGQGSADGAGATASFSNPEGVASAAGGAILVADTGNHAVRRIDAQGLVSTLAGGTGAGRVDGQGPAARFFDTGGIAASPDGTLFVADSGNAQIRRVSPSGNVSTLTMTEGSSTFSSLGVHVGALAAGADGTLYAGWFGGGTVTRGIAAIDPGGKLARRTDAYPQGIASTPRGLYYTIDRPIEGGLVEKLLPDGGRQVVASGLKGPHGIAADASGTLYVASRDDHTLRAIDLQGTVRLVAGKPGESGHADGTGDQARLTSPLALAMDDAGNLYVADAGTIRKVTPDGRVRTVAGAPGQLAMPGPLPGGIGTVKGLAWHAGTLYATVQNAVLRIGPLN